jgi:hypothetical protein
MGIPRSCVSFANGSDAQQSNQLSAERELRGLTTASSLRVSEGVGIAMGWAAKRPRS